MAITPPSAITVAIDPLPQPPQTSDPANFNSRADAFLGQMPVFAQQAELGRQQIQENAISIAANAQQAYDSANAAVNAPATGATSTTSMAIGAGSRAFTIQTGKQFAIGQMVTIAYTADPTQRMYGPITAFNSGTGAITVACEGSVGSGTYAAWTISLAGYTVVSQPSGATNTTTAVNLTLTAASTNQQSITPTALGVSVLLPAANTIFAGPKGAFTLTNRATKYPLGIKDSAGKLLGVIPPGETATCIPSDTSTASGAWEVSCRILWGALLCAESVMASNRAQSTKISDMWSSVTRVASLTPTLLVALCNNEASPSVQAFVIDLGSMAFGPRVTVGGGGANAVAEVYASGANSGVVCFTTSGIPNARAFTVSGTTITFGTTNPLGSNTAGGTAGPAHVAYFQLSPTSYLSVVGAGDCYAIAFTVSGTTITAPVSATTMGIFGCANGVAIAKVSASKFMVANMPSGQSLRANVFTISGTTITAGTPLAIVASATTITGASLLNMPGTNNYVYLHNSGAASFTESGGTLTLVTALTSLPSFTWSSGFPNSLAPIAPWAEAYSATKLVAIASYGTTLDSTIFSMNVTSGGVLTGDKVYYTGPIWADVSTLHAVPRAYGAFKDTVKLGPGLYIGSTLSRESTTGEGVVDSASSAGTIAIVKYDGTDFSAEDQIAPRGITCRSLFGRVGEQSGGYQDFNMYVDGAENIIGGKDDFWVMAGRRNFDAARGGSMRFCQQVTKISGKYALRLGSPMHETINASRVGSMVAQIYETVSV